MNMTEYIERDHVLYLIDENKTSEMNWDILENGVRELPPADVTPVVHTTASNEYWDELYCPWKTCGNCKGDNQSVATYCNWCGARLDGEEE